MGSIPMTPEGHKKLKEKLKHIRKVERPKNIKDIETARAHGDLSENAEYHAAKEKQGFLMAQLKDIEHKLVEAEVIDPATIKVEGKVVFGARVTLLDTETEDEKKYQIVGVVEADIAVGKISVESPIARSLIGQKLGSVVTVQTPRGQREFEILEIKYS